MSLHRFSPPLLLKHLTLVSHSPLLPLILHRTATHASAGRANKAKQGPGKRLGAKKSNSELVVPGNIIFRQRGTHWFPGENCGMGRDHTIFAREKGYVTYYKDDSRGGRKYIGVVFERGMKLPRANGEARRRRLGLEARVMEPEEEKEETRERTTISRRGNMHRESNFSIGRIAERENVKVRRFKPGDRFLAWRKRKARIERARERKSMRRLKK